ncbi:MAG: Cof-type HAD-IIB family hydrolase [Deltaproteobacteria bacterium]|jgi:hydroxymethylpyrimidine pyrophosphatase-like HAD family hydrolase|nr:Cof-type HAD-IIB family hydrolase [Deltaproteobacteria bacterium]
MNASSLAYPPKIIFSDYDGTLKPTHGQVAQADIEAFRELGRLSIIRVIATGRSLFTFNRDWPRDLELDYLIFSSGLGLCSWSSDGPGPLIASRQLPPQQVQSALRASIAANRGFFAFEPPPRCHCFVYQDPIGYPPTSGHLDRLRIYHDVASPYVPDMPLGPRGQFLITAPIAEMPPIREKFESMVENLSIFYSSSPFGDPCLWLEIFPEGINKGSAAGELARSLKLTPSEALAVGNDYNDISLLNYAGQAFVVSNSSPGVRSLYPHLPASTQAPMSHLVSMIKSLF